MNTWTIQNDTEKPTSQWWNQRRDQKIPQDKWQWNTTLQNVWDAANAVLRGKLISIQAFLKKQEKSQINNLTYPIEELEEQITHKVSRRKKIMRIREEINKIEIKRTIEMINKTKSWFLKDKQNLQTLSQAHLEEKREDPYKH